MPAGVLADSARPAADCVFCEKENALHNVHRQQEGAPFYGKELQSQLSSNCVLAAVTSVDSEAGQEQDCGWGLAPWEQLADSARLEDCLTIKKLAVHMGRSETQTPSACRQASSVNKSLHIRLIGGDADLQVPNARRCCT